MAKFCGFWDKNNDSNNNLLEMVSSLSSLGKKNQNIIENGNFKICGIYREDEDKYFFSKENISVVFFGYLLGDEYKNNFAEKVWYFFREKGKLFVKDLNGIFTIFIYDNIKKNVYVFNDRYGISPLYYYSNKERFVFGSEIKSIIKNNNVSKTINFEAWGDYFTFRYILGNKTFFKDIKSLSNGSVLIFNNGKIYIEKYWDYSEIKINNSFDIDYYINKGAELIKSSILLTSKNIKNPICFLSGGYDSRCLAASLKTFTGRHFVTYTTKHPTGKEDPVIAKQVAKKLKVKNIFIKHPINFFEKYFIKKTFISDGLAQEHIWAMPMSDYFDDSKEIKTNFDGLAGDLLLKGLFLDEVNIKYLNNKNKLKSVLFDQIAYDVSWTKKFFTKNISNKLSRGKESFDYEINNLPNSKNILTMFFAKNRTRNCLSLIANNIFWNLSKRFPFLENDLVNFSLSIPPEVKLHSHIYEKILNKCFPDLMKIPTTNTKTLYKKIDSFFWDILTSLNLQRIIKTFFKNYFFKKLFKQNDIDYLKMLTKGLKIPDYVNKELVNSYLGSNKFDFSFFSLVEHLVWYNLFFIA